MSTQHTIYKSLIILEKTCQYCTSLAPQLNSKPVARSDKGSKRAVTERPTGHISSVIFVNENENENYQKRKNNDFVNEKTKTKTKKY